MTVIRPSDTCSDSPLTGRCVFNSWTTIPSRFLLPGVFKQTSSPELLQVRLRLPALSVKPLVDNTHTHTHKFM